MNFSQTTFNFRNNRTKLNTGIYIKAKKDILECLRQRSFGFLEDLYNKDFSIITKITKKLKKYENILFLGTGGSSLGGKTLVSLMRNHFYDKKTPKIFFFENVDISSINGLLNEINLNNTACVVISKSGETIETISQFFLIENKFKKKNISLKNKIFIITEDKKSTLKSIQEANQYFFLAHPISVGGRYSVFSIVGLLPAALANFDVKKFCNGAKKFLKTIQEEKKFDNFMSPILSLYKLNKIGFNMSVIMPYLDSLNNLSFWYRQLWAESLGKNEKGITPVNALGTVDQHSQLQLYLDGPKDKFFTIIGKKISKPSIKLNCKYAKNKKYEIMHNKSLEELLDAEMTATIETLKKKKKPIRVIILDSLSEKIIGSLMMFFFIETIFCCFLNNVNPFDQPAVEEGKRLAKKFLVKNE